MSKIIEVIYEDGVFKPLEKVELKEGKKMRIKIEDKKDNRRNFLRTWKPIKLDKKLSLEEIQRLRLSRYEDIL
ncbi:MAG: antitoxin family protein [Archaeoglobus sp.]|nr:antitoxin family protein [Archaeoglobus sp.]